MDQNVKTTALQNIVLIQALDALNNYNDAGIIREVTAKRVQRELELGPAKAQQFGITKPEQFLAFNAEVMECALWEFSTDEEDTVATAPSCKLCAMAKNADLPSPCTYFCIAPSRGIIEGVEGGYKLDVEETLWNGSECRFRIRKG